MASGTHTHFQGAHPNAGAGMKLEAVMENLQRQQAARLALEDKLRGQAEKDKELRAALEYHHHQQQQQQALAFRHYQASVRGALAAHREHQQQRAAPDESDADDERTALDDDDEERELEEDSANEGNELGGAFSQYPPRHPGGTESPQSAHALSRVQAPYTAARQSESPNAQAQHHEWTYEEQFKQVRRNPQWPRTQHAFVRICRCFGVNNFITKY